MTAISLSNRLCSFSMVVIFAVTATRAGIRDPEGNRRSLIGDLKGFGIKQRVVFVGNGLGIGSVLVSRTEAEESALEWQHQYDYSDAFTTASFDGASGLYPLVSAKRRDIVAVFNLSASPGALVEVFSWRSSGFTRIGSFGGTNANGVYNVEFLPAAGERVALALDQHENRQEVIPTIYAWVGSAETGSFRVVNEQFPEYFRPIVEKNISYLYASSNWWPDSFVQILSRIVVGDVYRRKFDEAVKICQETLPRIDTESHPTHKLPATASEAEKRLNEIKFESDKTRAKADIHLLLAALYERAGKGKAARLEFRAAEAASSAEFEYQRHQVKEFIRRGLGAPLRVRLD